jgi:F-type H+-transporting ATPase subunit epsilon
MSLKIAIVTPEQEVLAIDADEIVVSGANGEVGILPGHIPIITALRPGVLTVIRGNRKSFFATSTGFAEMEDNQVTVLTDSCEEASSIDIARAKKALQDAEEKLKTLSPDEPSGVEYRRRADRAMARINAAERTGEHRPIAQQQARE